MKKLSREQMKKVMGGNMPPDDKPCSKCCTKGSTTDCTACMTGLTCTNGGELHACKRTNDGLCAA